MTADLGFRLWRDGYDALPRLRRASGPTTGTANGPRGDAFETSLLGRRAVVVRGRAGAQLFYDTTLVRRHGAMPPPVAALLFGRGAVHGLDGDAHAARKRLFLDLLTPEATAPLAATIGRDLAERASSWRGEVRVFDQLVETYGAAVLGWAGIEVTSQEARVVSHRLAAIVDGFGGAPRAYPRGWAARVWGDRWARHLIDRIRRRDRATGPDTVLGRLARSELITRVAAVELLNLLRPTVAVAWHGTFAALELAQHPQARARIVAELASEGASGGALGASAGSAPYARAFVHEVRRLSPFVPALAGKAQQATEIDGVRIAPDDLIILDVDGTDRDPRRWERADEFDPERFLGVEPDPFGFVPQGGGDPAAGHRCPGEPLAVEMLVETVRALAPVDYEIVSPPRYDATRMPTRPECGLVVRRRG